MTKIKRQECEVYSRVTGFLRPISAWNDAKQAEYINRKPFKLYDGERPSKTLSDENTNS